MISLVVAIFVRVILLASIIDVFAVTALYDIFFFIAHLLAIIVALVGLNTENRNSATSLSHQEFRYNMDVSKIRHETYQGSAKKLSASQKRKLQQSLYKLDLVRSTLRKIRSLDMPVTILGLVVDEAFLWQLIAFVLTGAGAGLAQLVQSYSN